MVLRQLAMLETGVRFPLGALRVVEALLMTKAKCSERYGTMYAIAVGPECWIGLSPNTTIFDNLVRPCRHRLMVGRQIFDL